MPNRGRGPDVDWRSDAGEGAVTEQHRHMIRRLLTTSTSGLDAHQTAKVELLKCGPGVAGVAGKRRHLAGEERHWASRPTTTGVDGGQQAPLASNVQGPVLCSQSLVDDAGPGLVR